jgi:hypothetical protein
MSIIAWVKQRWSLVANMLLLAGVLAGSMKTAQAFTGNSWSQPLLLYRSEYNVTNPLVVADVFGVVHVFWVEEDPDGNISPAIFYCAYRDDHWTTPTNVLVTPGGGSIAGLEVAIGPSGRIHAVWQGPNNTLYYSSALGSEASNPRAWSTPLALGNAFSFSGVATDTSQGVYIAYPLGNTQGVYLNISWDGGVTWEGPRLVSPQVNSQGGVNYTPVAVAPDGTIYVAWSEFKYPESWPPLGVYVAVSYDQGESWSLPAQMAGEGYDQINIAINSVGDAYLAWNGMIGVGGRYVSKSINRGLSWSAPVEVIPRGVGGTSGYPGIAFDSNNREHFITSFDVDPIGGIHYLYFNASQWSAPELLSIGFSREQYETFSLELPRLAIRLGYQVWVVYEAGFKEIYIQMKTLDTPAFSTPYPTEIKSTETPIPTETGDNRQAIPTATVIIPQGSLTPTNLNQPFVIGALFALAAIVLVYFIYFQRKER